MMATYNGAHYLEEQIDSILAQKDVDVTLLIGDDLSTDETAAICHRYEARDKRVRFKVNAERLGVGLNFMRMVYEASGDYDFYAFSDQDDVWLENKLVVAVRTIEKSLADGHIRSVEGFGYPALYCSDLCNVDADLSNPRKELQELSPDAELRATPLIRNYYSGCTMVFNRDFLNLARRYRYDNLSRIHDAFSYCLAYYCGTAVVDSDNALILRRISGSNVEGEVTLNRDYKKASPSRVLEKSERKMTAFAKMLLDDFGDLMSDGDRRLIESFCSYGDSLSSRIQWALSRDYQCLSWRDSLLKRSKFLFKRY